MKALKREYAGKLFSVHIDSKYAGFIRMKRVRFGEVELIIQGKRVPCMKVLVQN